MASQSISWQKFANAYASCIGRFADFTTELAVEAHKELNLPYVDPFAKRARRISDQEKSIISKTKNHEAFARFVEVIRKKEPFLRKATEKELEGIFVRLTPNEKIKYSESATSAPSIVKVRKSESPPKDKEEDFISSDDVSLVSESSNELVDLPVMHKEKKEKKENKDKLVRPLIRKFQWS